MLLVTGFDAFDGATTNPTQTLVERLASRSLTDVVTRILPTSFARSEVTLAATLRAVRPTAVCMLGLNARATTLRFEHVALNLNQATKPDNDGEVRCHQLIRESGPVAYFSRLPFEAMRQEAEARGEVLEPSRDAGGFVCNHVFYTAADLLAHEQPESRAGFVHVPPLSGARLDTVTKVLEAWVAVFRSSEA